MFCETCKRRVHPADAGGPPSLSANGELVSSLQNGMHALAQPMTLLSSYFYLAGQRDNASPGAQSSPSLLADATAAVTDLCALFRLMQELLHVSSAAPKLSAVPVSSVLQSLSQDAEAVFAGTGLRLAVEYQSPPLSYGCESVPPPSVFIDLARVRGALASMLHLLAAHSGAGSPVHCRVTDRDSGVTLLIASEQTQAASPGHPLGEADRLHLALVEANLVGQQTDFSVATRPWKLSLTLPAAHPEA